MRRIMIMSAERIAKNNGCGALITGESLAQVASQTVESITSTNQAVELLNTYPNKIPVICENGPEPTTLLLKKIDIQFQIVNQ